MEERSMFEYAPRARHGIGDFEAGQQNNDTLSKKGIAVKHRLDHAFDYVRQGWSVFPCNIDKTPRIKNGFHNSSRDPEQIREWWTKWPDASIGAPTGAVNGFWVLDIDLPDGPGSLAELEAKHGKLPATLRQRTGGGGFQYFFKWNGQEIRNSAGKVAPGIDVRGNGGYVILPPSRHPSGGCYEWL